MPSPKITFRAQPALMQELQARGDSPGLVSMWDLERYYDILTATRKGLARTSGFTTKRLAFIEAACREYRWSPAPLFRHCTTGNWVLVAAVEQYAKDRPDDARQIDVENLVLGLRALMSWATLSLIDALERYWRRIDAGEAVDIGELLA